MDKATRSGWPVLPRLKATESASDAAPSSWADPRKLIAESMEEWPAKQIPRDVHVRFRLEGLLAGYHAKKAEYLNFSCQPFLSDEARTARRSVLVAAGVSISMSVLGLTPKEIPIIGVQSSDVSASLLLGATLVAVGCFTVSYIVYTLRDLQARRSALARLEKEWDALGYRIAEEGIVEGFVLGKLAPETPAIAHTALWLSTLSPIAASLVAAGSVGMNLVRG